MAVGDQLITGAEAPKPAPWNDPRYRSGASQVLVFVGLLLFVIYIVNNTAANLERAGIAGGYGFLDDTAGFDILFSLISYSNISTYAEALLVGFYNTILVSVVGIILATIIGVLMGVARLSNNWLIAKLATVYVEIMRNIPLLLQLIFWYTAVLGALPTPRNSASIADAFFLNNRGIITPKPIFEDGFAIVPVALLVAMIASILIGRWANQRRESTGRRFPVGLVSAGLVIGLPILAFFLSGMPVNFEYPEAGRFQLVGGLTLPPEFMALLLGLSLYTGAFIAENVRAGILSVDKGQWEAAGALGLKRGTALRLIILPQALRVIIPPQTSQYLNLTKNSSLAVAIAYPELVSIGGTVLNQTGQAVEIVAIWMVVYVTLSLATSLFMNWYNARMRLVER